ncbi:hypothetical protein ACFCX0_03685 [Streptomyces sp. NPDC056352]|uniref:hypothetical protein n=1 Tax=Streptomyces sp. NPDC056352 TaxID=3345791 RepID=UPI0035D81718
MTRICRHPLRLVPHAPGWLACDTCQADFRHREDCTERGGQQCITACMNSTPELHQAQQEVYLLEALYELPATDHPTEEAPR